MTKASHKAILDELHALLDCVQTDGSISGLDECQHETTLGQVLYGVLESRQQLLEACRAALRLPTLSLYSETVSGSHRHSERKAAEYYEKMNAVLAQIRTAIKSATGETL